MPIIDFRYRPSTRESIDSVMTNPVYSEYVKLTDFPKRPVKSLDACIEELKELGIVKAVVAGRDCESSYDTPNTNTSVLECIGFETNAVNNPGIVSSPARSMLPT